MTASDDRTKEELFQCYRRGWRHGATGNAQDAAFTEHKGHGEVMCKRARVSDTVWRTRAELVVMNREHPSNYSAAKIRRVTGR